MLRVPHHGSTEALDKWQAHTKLGSFPAVWGSGTNLDGHVDLGPTRDAHSAT